MTPLDLAHPLASLLDAARADGRKLSQRDLGEARVPPVAQASVANAIEAGDKIKLSTLAAYALAAGYTLWLRATRGAECYECVVDRALLLYTVEGAVALFAAVGLTMTLAVEPAEGSGG